MNIQTEVKTNFQENVKTKKKVSNPWAIFVLGSSFLLMIIASYLFFNLQDDFMQFREDRLNSTIGAIFLYIATGLFIFHAMFFLYTVIRYFKYKPIPSVSDEALPTTTVIVQAYNEGTQVYDTILSFASIEYHIIN